MEVSICLHSILFLIQWIGTNGIIIIASVLGLAAGLSVGAAGEFMRRTINSSESQGSLLMSEANVSRLVDKLSQMRGAALKIGQFLSIQGRPLFISLSFSPPFTWK
jgi:predicted unusual protein kinase regulating ubiquinone biosynthesis (AarF/ABC1/UbiB family)